jgi:hypothetical protein
MSREMCLAGIELAPFAGAHNLVGVGDRRRPVKALAERVAHEGARCRMMTAYDRMNISNQLSALGNGDASLQNP